MNARIDTAKERARLNAMDDVIDPGMMPALLDEIDRLTAALAAAQQPAPVNREAAPRAVDPLREALDLILANINTKSKCACMGPRFGEPLCPCAMTHAARDRLLQMRAALAAAPQPAPVDALEGKIYGFLRAYRQVEVCDEEGDGYPLVDALSIDRGGIDVGEREIAHLASELAHALAAAPQPVPVPVPVDREALVAILLGHDLHLSLSAEQRNAIADALLAAGLRLPGAVQPDETLAWAVIDDDGRLSLVNYDRLTAVHFAGHGEQVVRVAIRIVEDEA